MQPNHIEWTTVNDDGDEVTHRLPSVLTVCPCCRGTGSIVNPSIDGHGIGAEEWENEWSEEEREGYFRGVYDISCPECHGNNVVPVVDEARADPVLLKAYHEHLRDEAVYRRECESERRYGA